MRSTILQRQADISHRVRIERYFRGPFRKERIEKYDQMRRQPPIRERELVI